MRWVEAWQLKCHLDYDQFSAVTIYFTLGLAQVYIISDRCVVAMLELLASDCQRFLNQSRMCLFNWFTTFCPGFVYVTYDRILQSETKRPHHIHSLRSSCFIKSQHSTSQETLLWSWNSRSKAYLVTLAEIQDTSAREVAKGHSSCILSFDPIGQHQNKRFYVTKIVLPLGLADAIFRRERSDHRKCVFCSQATYLQMIWKLKGLKTKQKKNSEVIIMMMATLIIMMMILKRSCIKSNGLSVLNKG